MIGEYFRESHYYTLYRSLELAEKDRSGDKKS